MTLLYKRSRRVSQSNLLPNRSNLIYIIDIIQLSPPDTEINVLKITYSTAKQLNTSLNLNSFIQSLFVPGAEIFIVSPNVYCSNFLQLFSILQSGEKICLRILQKTIFEVFLGNFWESLKSSFFQVLYSILPFINILLKIAQPKPKNNIPYDF